MTRECQSCYSTIIFKSQPTFLPSSLPFFFSLFLPSSPSLILSSFLPNCLFLSLPFPLPFPSLLRQAPAWVLFLCVLEDKLRCCSSLSTLFKKEFLIHCGVCQGRCPSHLGSLQSLPPILLEDYGIIQTHTLLCLALCGIWTQILTFAWPVLYPPISPLQKGLEKLERFCIKLSWKWVLWMAEVA